MPNSHRKGICSLYHDPSGIGPANPYCFNFDQNLIICQLGNRNFLTTKITGFVQSYCPHFSFHSLFTPDLRIWYPNSSRQFITACTTTSFCKVVPLFSKLVLTAVITFFKILSRLFSLLPAGLSLIWICS